MDLGEPAVSDLKERGAESWTEEEAAGVAAYEAKLALVESLGEASADNWRIYKVTRIVLALAKGQAPDPADVAALEAAQNTFEASPIRDEVLKR